MSNFFCNHKDLHVLAYLRNSKICSLLHNTRDHTMFFKAFVFLSISLFCVPKQKLYSIRERSHKTSAAEGGGGFKMLTVAEKGEGGLSLADVSKNTKILAKIASNQAGLSLCVRLLH